MRIDKLGVVVAALGIFALVFQSFLIFRANRIVPGETVPAWEALGPGGIALYAGLGVALLILLLKTPLAIRLGVSSLALIALAVAVGLGSSALIPEGDSYARVSPGSGVWIMVFAFALAATDALARLRLGPFARVGILIAVAAVLWGILASGLWDDLAVMREYQGRQAAFFAQLQIHLFLAFGSVAAAVLIGVPVGIVCYRIPRVRAGILGSLNVVQTIPSIALFGLLIAPMAWVGANVPGARELGIGGIGYAPAFLALFAYSLLPIVSNTVVGLDGVPRDANEAARGMGMTSGQRMTGVLLPLAFPVILTGIRIILVQNIGLAVIAGLIGGGGLGTFVFQGISQTAMPLVLLGAIPAVAMAFAAAIVLDAGVELSQGRQRAGQ
ncbi:ABC transporter permease [Pelagibacterium halotolerans]|uniref:L-proline glycine betaine ABC transport system permease protein ProW n=1 Tax=Pelagibacterium halotolerans (strain DSM 22347 / JCM 15775 / CGMCC 1.7692 / B2) TaxID=1082931 RepID=G4R7I9_PELHB|nr:ABC transporter permease [Pelagibacterium halotolerans]AEQ52290.1 L-proline glycine betaine ABC transport system permease protein ProW [Pelagibacterium halotolerans B2]SEA32292.1 osmoprotectant transport system permease protein [Pelagibacterium halotolerans]